MAFEQGDTLIEFIRVVGEASVRKGWEIGFASAFVFVTGEKDDRSILTALRIARRYKAALDVHWQHLPEAQMLVISAGDESAEEPTQVIGMSHHTYDTLDQFEISNEPIEGDDGRDDD